MVCDAAPPITPEKKIMFRYGVLYKKVCSGSGFSTLYPLAVMTSLLGSSPS